MGGDPDRFRKTAAGVTPFIIIYTSDENGVLRFKEYISTGKAENTPSFRENMPRLYTYFNDWKAYFHRVYLIYYNG